MQRGCDVLGYHDVQDVGSSQGVVWVSGWGILSKDSGVPVGIITQEFSPSCAQPRVPILVFGVEVAGHKDRHSPAEIGGQVRSDQVAGMGEVSRKYFHRLADHCDLDGSSLQMGEARNGN